MTRLHELFIDNQTIAGRVVTSAAIVVLATLLSLLIARFLARREDDAYARYYKRKFTRYAFAVLAVVALATLWRPFGGQIGVVLGLVTAGVAFAMQEVIGAVAGWFNILSGRIFRVGDRIEMGGVRGDVIDVSPLRTKILEMGSPVLAPDLAGDAGTWVRGRQYTGRIVSVSNKATFTEPVYNYSAGFDYIWEELFLPISYRSDWRIAERILLEEVAVISDTKEARDALTHMTSQYPVPQTELEPRVFVRATDNWIELAARFIVPVRTARTVKDRLTRRVLDRLYREQIQIGSQTLDATVRVHNSRPDGSDLGAPDRGSSLARDEER